MITRLGLLGAAILVTGLMLTTGCSQQADQAKQSEAKPAMMRGSYELKPGVRLSYQPQNAEELAAIRTDLIILIKLKKINTDEARQFLRSQKKRLGLANPDQTDAFDQMLKDEQLI